MSDHFWLSEAQLARITHIFPCHTVCRVVDDRKVVSCIIHVIRNGLRWWDAPAVNGPHKILYNKFIRWSKMGVFDHILASLVAESEPPDRLMIDANHIKAHRTVCSLLKAGMFPALSAVPKAARIPSYTRFAMAKAAQCASY